MNEALRDDVCIKNDRAVYPDILGCCRIFGDPEDGSHAVAQHCNDSEIVGVARRFRNPVTVRILRVAMQGLFPSKNC
jgi:hypothetical protein